MDTCFLYHDRLLQSLGTPLSAQVGFLSPPSFFYSNSHVITGVHCPAVTALKPPFWQSLYDMAFYGLWLVLGDFNAIMSQSEKRGGKPFASSSRFALGNELDFCNLIDLSFIGSVYTWSNKRPGVANIQFRLDRGKQDIVAAVTTRAKNGRRSRRTGGRSFTSLRL
ncbi:UNVERIFIED_CONTAM: hypothetical protein Slati_3927200 [Sesamum latifolium]|uniref:Uncharacterized protein n=1 Tax=Sesamum latifolium TaxID=2727402 RepID=A0AAW2TNS6_9LAMI